MRVGVIARWQPLHLGGASMLEAVCERADHVVVGIGSCNKHDFRNPFTLEEREAMLRSFLDPICDSYDIVHIPDYGHIPEYADGQRWVQEVLSKYGELDYFVSGNEYCKSLLGSHYTVVHPVEWVEPEKRMPISATMIREAMAKGEPWQHMVPESIASYLVDRGLAERFVREFGLETIASFAYTSFDAAFGLEKEKKNVQGGQYENSQL